MKKNLIVILTAIAVLATATTAAACAAKRSASSKAAAPAPVQQTAAEETEEVINDGQNPVMNFIGNYYCGRAELNVEPDGANGAKITVSWGSSYDTKAVWSMTGIFNEETTSVSYNNGFKKMVTYNEKGDIVKEEVLSTDLKGVFVFSYDGVTWDEYNENIAENMVFKLNGNVEDSVEEAGTVVFPEETVTIKHDKPAEKKDEPAPATEAKPTEAPKPTEKPAEPEVKPAETEKTPAEPAANEPAEEIKDPALRTADEISGTYVCGRATATVDAADPANVMIKIVWADSADTKAIWNIRGRFNEVTDTIVYEGGVKRVNTYGEDGEVIIEEVCYTDGNGAVVFSYDGFTWSDYNENVAENMVFIKEA